MCSAPLSMLPGLNLIKQHHSVHLHIICKSHTQKTSSAKKWRCATYLVLPFDERWRKRKCLRDFPPFIFFPHFNCTNMKIKEMSAVSSPSGPLSCLPPSAPVSRGGRPPPTPPQPPGSVPPASEKFRRPQRRRPPTPWWPASGCCNTNTSTGGWKPTELKGNEPGGFKTSMKLLSQDGSPLRLGPIMAAMFTSGSLPQRFKRLVLVCAEKYNVQHTLLLLRYVTNTTTITELSDINENNI